MARPKKKSSAARDGELSFGQVVGAFGVNGELRVHLHNRSSTLLHGGGEVVLAGPKGERETVQLMTRGGTGGRVLARVRGVDTPEQVVAWLDWEILIPVSMLPELPEGEFYHHDILRAMVMDDQGKPLGMVTEIHDHGSVEVWVIKTPKGEEAYFPVLLENLVEVNPALRRIVLKAGVIQCA